MKKLVFGFVGLALVAAVLFGGVASNANKAEYGKTANIQTFFNEHGETF
ncbi:hypothetical protein [Caenibacillus caldisaponilyticus]|jgi:hypothetical protein|nr:hypothetical protein [Caenibacillus caldisaponilyticus]